MLSITITTSMKTQTYVFADIPVNDEIQLHYDQCDYCDKEPVRRENIQVTTRQLHRFCTGSHRKAYCIKGLAHVTA